MTKRLFDTVFSLFLIMLLLPLFICVSIMISMDSRGGVFFGQTRVGFHEKTFQLWKFRTMRPNAESSGQLTVGARDSRITKVGFILRKYKMDELPQLWNVFIGEMSLVGPRPEVPKYVNQYTIEQKRVFEIKPGITDYASLLYFSESELLAASSDPEKTYITEIMPEKLKLNLEYLRDHSFRMDMAIILKTIAKIFS